VTHLDISSTTLIDAPEDLVRQQFADVIHHASAHPHRGVRFEVVDDNGETCRYHQITRVGPLRLRQELELRRVADQPMVNHITKGQLAGGTITFEITPTDACSAQVTATVRAPLKGPMRIGAPLLRRTVQRSLVRALLEDKHDIESGTYSG